MDEKDEAMDPCEVFMFWASAASVEYVVIVWVSSTCMCRKMPAPKESTRSVSRDWPNNCWSISISSGDICWGMVSVFVSRRYVSVDPRSGEGWMDGGDEGGGLRTSNVLKASSGSLQSRTERVGTNADMVDDESDD